MSRVIGYRTSNRPTVTEAFGMRSPARAADEEQDENTYLDKLVKYVPAEITAISAGLFATFDINGRNVWIALVVLAAINVVFLMVTAQASKTAPKWYFYVLATVAFGAWGVATVGDIASAFNLDTEAKRAYVLAAAAFLIPLVDRGLAFFDKD